MGSTPSRSIFALDSAENLGRFAMVLYSRSFVGFTSGVRPAALKIRLA
jgi:hypothetical protein